MSGFDGCRAVLFLDIDGRDSRTVIALATSPCRLLESEEVADSGGCLLHARRMMTVPYDAVSWLVSLLIASMLRFEFRVDLVPFASLTVLAVIIAALSLGVGFFTHLYRHRFLIGSLDELWALMLTTAVVTVVGGAGVVLGGNSWGLARSTVFIAAPIFFLLSGGLRVYLRYGRLRDARSGVRSRALIYGAGDAAEALIPQLLADTDAPYHPVVLVDDALEKANRWIRGVPMGGQWKDLSELVSKYEVDTVIVAVPSATSELLSRVYADASELGLQVIVLPTLAEYLGGQRSISELRSVGIEDLIGRAPIALDSSGIGGLIAGKRVLVSGAGGSIGSELARQIVGFKPELLTLVDHDETGLLAASMDIESAENKAPHEIYLANIRDKDSISVLFRSRRPEVVFHAAALKHLPILEQFPAEAWKTNVEGTNNILEASADVGVSVFVNISTDKAASPVNALGRSKKIGEELTAWFGSTTSKSYVSVRFGNVLGSRGSIVPVIAKQIAQGGPVTITDKGATRYFMSIPEACQLVLQSAAEGEAGDVMVLDMGEPVNIDEIGKRMIELSGKNVAIEYVGLRPGEKLHEDLLSTSETLIPSSHPKIFRLKATPTSPSEALASPWR